LFEPIINEQGKVICINQAVTIEVASLPVNRRLR
jgi:hypothetical protein